MLFFRKIETCKKTGNQRRIALGVELMLLQSFPWKTGWSYCGVTVAQAAALELISWFYGHCPLSSKLQLDLDTSFVTFQARKSLDS